MRILYATTARLDAAQPQVRSGAIPVVLRSAGLDVVCVDRLCEPLRRGLVATARSESGAGRGAVELDRWAPLLRAYAATVQAAQRRHRADAVVVGESPLVTFLQLDVPVVSWTDAVFGGMVGYYPEFTGLSAGTVRRGHRQERLALHRVTAAVFLSEWAAAQARALYAVPAERVHVIPFGGALTSLPSAEEIDRSIERRAADKELGLLWVGRNWLRKGGDIAVQTAGILRERGHEVTLTLIGVTPPEAVRGLPWVRCLGLLSRSSEVERQRLFSAFLNSHVHLLPTRAECMGLGAAEASAYGVPSVVTGTGGTSSVVVDGSTGFLVAEGSGAEQYADAVERIFAAPGGFATYAAQAHQDYVDRLSYPVIGRRLRQLLEGLYLGGS